MSSILLKKTERGNMICPQCKISSYSRRPESKDFTFTQSIRSPPLFKPNSLCLQSNRKSQWTKKFKNSPSTWQLSQWLKPKASFIASASKNDNIVSVHIFFHSFFFEIWILHAACFSKAENFMGFFSFIRNFI